MIIVSVVSLRILLESFQKERNKFVCATQSSALLRAAKLLPNSWIADEVHRQHHIVGRNLDKLICHERNGNLHVPCNRYGIGKWCLLNKLGQYSTCKARNEYVMVKIDDTLWGGPLMLERRFALPLIVEGLWDTLVSVSWMFDSGSSQTWQRAHLGTCCLSSHFSVSPQTKTATNTLLQFFEAKSKNLILSHSPFFFFKNKMQKKSNFLQKATFYCIAWRGTRRHCEAKQDRQILAGSNDQRFCRAVVVTFELAFQCFYRLSGDNLRRLLSCSYFWLNRL